MGMNRRRFLVTGLGATGALLWRGSDGPLFAAQRKREVSAISDATRTATGADIPWTTYLAAEMKTNGTVLGPKYGPFLVEMESSRQRCVKLGSAGEYVEFTVAMSANAMVVRYCLPDSEDGKGIDSTLSLYRNGKLLREVPV